MPRHLAEGTLKKYTVKMWDILTWLKLNAQVPSRGDIKKIHCENAVFKKTIGKVSLNI